MFSEVPTARPKDRDLAEIPMAASGTKGFMGPKFPNVPGVCKAEKFDGYMGVLLKMLCKPLNPMVLLIIIPFLNGYFIGNIPNIFRPTHINPHGSSLFPCSTSRLRPLLRHGVRSRGGRKGKGRLVCWANPSHFYGAVVRWEHHRTKNRGDVPAMFQINFLSAGKKWNVSNCHLEVSLELRLNLYMYCLLRLFTSP